MRTRVFAGFAVAVAAVVVGGLLWLALAHADWSSSRSSSGLVNAGPPAEPVDGDGDGIPDATDNCPAWPNPGQALPPWPVPADDPDCDGFTTTLEDYVGTDPLDCCGPNAWPPDVNGNGTVSGGDAFEIMDFWLTSETRYDLDTSGTVSGGDVFLLFDWWLASCT